MSAPFTAYNVAPSSVNVKTGSGMNTGWFGSGFMTFTTQTFSNVNVSSNSVIIIGPVALAGNNNGCPRIFSQTTGAFSVRWIPLPSPCVINYLILNS
jgi:hypothetical protein